MNLRVACAAMMPIASLIFGSCTIRAGGNLEDEMGGSPSTMESPPEVDPCVAADALPDAEKEAAAKAAEAQLVSEGKTLAEAWSDPAVFELFQNAAYGAVDCDLAASIPSAPGEQHEALHADAGPDYYCGPGHGADLLLVPAVSDCLNVACRAHDACYAQCSAPTGALCMWGGPTSACDDPFMVAMRACHDDTHEFSSLLVRFVATSLYSAGATAFGCPSEMTCTGEGPCLLDRKSDDCSFCLEKRDVGSVCHDRACVDDADETTCYTANCPAVGGCYGGYNVPVKPVDELPVEITPESMWTFSVLQAVIPDFKPSGDTWDGDAGGFTNPDVSISVRVGSVDAPLHRTTQIEDMLIPMWPEAPPLFVASALELQSFMEITATDGDLALDDVIGSCSTALTSGDFTGDPVEITCTADGRTAFAVYIALTPAP